MSNRFTITDKKIGKGGFGEVFIAYEKNSMNKIYAAKEIKYDKLKNADNGEDEKEDSKKEIKDMNDVLNKTIIELNNEVSILLDFNNKNLVKLYDIVSNDNSISLILEYSNGGDLAKVFSKWANKNKSEVLPENIIRKIIKDVLNGLSCLHRNYIIHHDIKLQNILVFFNNEEDLNNLNLIKAHYKLSDFGLSQYYVDLKNVQFGGTMDYLPFEILNCMKYSKNNNNEEMKKYLQSDKIDMFAIGILIYKLLFCLNPFVTNKSTKTEAILKSINENTFDILQIKFGNRKKISKEILVLLDTLLKKNPEKRYKSELCEFSRFITRKSKDFHYIDKNNIETIKIDNFVNVDVDDKIISIDMTADKYLRDYDIFEE
jgi:serine/threonine protein kinase